MNAAENRPTTDADPPERQRSDEPRTRYEAYAYAYPHKTAYRKLDPPLPLGQLWADEPRTGRFLYVHVPFCEARCGFCNLFTQHRPPPGHTGAFLDALEREAAAVTGEIGTGGFARVAIGGGTPTLLESAELRRLFKLIEGIGADTATTPTGFETSPATATTERLAVLADHGVQRVSIGVQSFVNSETRSLARPQDPAAVHRALDALTASGIPRRNVDLIYGIDGQTPRTFVASIDEALRHEPEEMYLYPLYVRPLTGLGRSARSWDDVRHELYRAGRDRLLAAGYDQLSMRSFVRSDLVDAEGPDYDCQDDPMVGLGVGARSYTRSVHYSHDFAVARGAVAGIVDRYLVAEADDLRFATHGFHLDEDEQRRRWAIKSLLRMPGLDRTAYRSRFGTDVVDDLPRISDLIDRGWMEVTVGGDLRPTGEGLGWSDQIGPALFSGAVRRLSTRFELR